MTTPARPDRDRSVPVAVPPAQRAEWLLDRVEPGHPSAVRRRVYAVEGDLDTTALRTAWTALLSRHAVLRTVLAAGPGVRGPVAEVPAEPAPGSFVDLGLVCRTGRVTAADLAAGIVARPLPLGGPPARLVVGRTGAVEHVLALQVHRAVADEESMAVLVGELAHDCAAALYERPLLRALPALPPAATGPRGPGAGPFRTGARPGPGGVVRFEGDLATGRGIAALAGPGGDPADVVRAAVAALLARRSGAPAVTLAVPVPAAVRPTAVGPWTGTATAEVEVAPGGSFRDLVAALARRPAPAPDPGPADGAAALVAVAPAEPVLRLPGATVRPLPVDDGTARAALALTFDRLQPWPAGELRHRLDALDGDAARLLVEQLDTLLAAAVAAPGTAVRDLPLEPPSRTRARVAAADRIAAGPAPDGPVGALVHRVARHHPDLPAVVRPDGTELSYAGLARRAAAVTAALRALPRPVAGRPVVLRAGSGAEQVAAALGVLDAGAHLLCLGPRERGERVLGLLAGIGPAALVVAGADPGDPVAALVGEGAVLDLAGLADADGPGAAPPLQAPAGGPADLAYLACTSGTTGRPKAVPQTHGALGQMARWFADRFGIGPGSRVAQWAAPGYDAALVEAFAALAAGAVLCPVPDRMRAHPEELAEWLAARRITHLQTVPSFARPLLAAVARRPAGAAPLALRRVLLAGEALSADLARAVHAAWPGVRLTNLYGPTESILATAHDVGPDADGATGPGAVAIGRPIPGRQVLVLDADDRPCPPGVTGEIVVRGPHVTVGYVGAPAAAAAAFRPLRAGSGAGPAAGRCYRTGDLGRARPDGTLEFRGRRDHQVKVNGMRVEPAEVEAVLGTHPSVAACAVVPVPGPDGLTARLAAFVVPVPGAADAAPAHWRRHVGRHFGSTLLPLTCRPVEDLPRGAGGKVDRRRLLARAVLASPPAAPAAGPSQEGHP